MAQYYTDFSEHPTGATPSGWTEHYPFGPVVEVRADATSPGGKILEMNPEGGTTNLSVFTWDVVDGTADAECVARFSAGNSPYLSSLRLSVRNDYDNSDNRYVVRARDYGAELFRDASYETLATTTDNIIDQSQDYWLRIRANGSTISGSVWQHGSSEPPSFQMVATDSSSSLGKVGIIARNTDGFKIHEFGVGTSGDSAPTSPVALPGPNAPTGLTLTEV